MLNTGQIQIELDAFAFGTRVKKANLLYRMGSRDAAIDEIHKLDAQNPLLPLNLEGFG